MQDLLSVLFFIKRNKVDKRGLVPIYMRITYKGRSMLMKLHKREVYKNLKPFSELKGFKLIR